MDRRDFLTGALGAMAVPAALPGFRGDALRTLVRANERHGFAIDGGAPDDEDYWATVRRAFDLDDTWTNLNNGGVCPTPVPVLEAMIRDLRWTSTLPVEHMWKVIEPRMPAIRRELAREFGCDDGELAVTRNASEAMETLILGLDLRRGDEVVVTTHNYPRMLTAWEQRARRDGVVVRRVTFPVPPGDPMVIADRVWAAVTPATKAIELPHITNLTGQITPIAEIVRRARVRDIPVFVDGAHAFAHFPLTRDELGCDYYGTSLHKWLLAPIGTGFLYVRRDRIPGIWPLMAAPQAMDADITKFEEIGTHPQANFNAIAVALSFHRGIGAERKAARMRWLRDRWARPLMAVSDRVRILTPLDDPRQACGIGFVSVSGLDAAKLYSWLRSRWQIVTTPIVHDEFTGLRITPNVYTMAREADLFVEAVTAAIRKGIA